MAGSRGSSNSLVVLIEEFYLDLNLIFFVVWFFEFVFLTVHPYLTQKYEGSTWGRMALTGFGS
jgi:hypothetical protein